jgi:hypothetical protein
MTIDRNVVETERYINDEMAHEQAACEECAIGNGHTVEEAALCDDYSVGCPDCPFRKRANNASSLTAGG